MEGVRQKIEPPEPVEEDVYEFDDKKLAKFYIKTLPASLSESLDEMKKSRMVRSVLGDYLFEKFIEAKRREWDENRLQVTEWEVKRYLHI